MKILPLNEYERISDLALITIISMSFPIEAIDRDPKYAPRVFFLFKKTSDLERLISAYWSGQLSVDPQEFFNQLKKIKARIHGDQ